MSYTYFATIWSVSALGVGCVVLYGAGYLSNSLSLCFPRVFPSFTAFKPTHTLFGTRFMGLVLVKSQKSRRVIRGGKTICSKPRAALGKRQVLSAYLLNEKETPRLLTVLNYISILLALQKGKVTNYLREFILLLLFMKLSKHAICWVLNRLWGHSFYICGTLKTVIHCLSSKLLLCSSFIYKCVKKLTLEDIISFQTFCELLSSVIFFI